MQIDKKEFQDVARVVKRFNKYAIGLTVDSIAQQMESLAHRYLWSNDSSYVATGGFMLTGYNTPSGERAVKATVSVSIFDNLES